MRQDTSKSDCSTDQGIEFFVTTDGELQVTGCDTFDFEIFGGVAGEFENFGCEVLEDGGDVDGGFGSNAHLILGVVLEETLDTAAGELQTSLRTVRLLRLDSRLLWTCLASG